MNWYPKKLNLDYSSRIHVLERKKTENHPLKPLIVTVHEKGKHSKDKIDSKSCPQNKITASTSWGGIDPLSAALQDYDTLNHGNNLNKVKSFTSHCQMTLDYIEEDFQNWSSKRNQILMKYTTSEKLSIKTSFLNGGTPFGTVVTSCVRNLQKSSLAEKVKNRLEQLDDFEEGSVREMLDLTQQEYVNKIDDLNLALRDSWDQDQRVKALKIVIQCAKLLADISVLQFYPSKFVLITDILDNFGSLVYKRILYKAESPHLLQSAQETCRNWFYKIASIRELIPRFYVEVAILRTLSFIIDPKQIYAENCKAFRRLTLMIRGIGDPLVSLYARAYLCRCAIEIIPQEKSIFEQNFTDFIYTFNQFDCINLLEILKSQKVDFSVYLTLYIPGLDWILQCLTYKASDTLLNTLLDEFKTKLKFKIGTGIYCLLLNSIISSFKPYFISEQALEFTEMVKEAVSATEKNGLEEFPIYLMLKNLGIAFVNGSTAWYKFDHEIKLKLMNTIWKKVSKLKSFEHIACANVWIDFVVQHFGINEINPLLQDIVKYMQPDRAFEDHYSEVISIISKVVKYSKEEDLVNFFAMDSFVPFIDMLQKESIKVEACKIIVEVYLEKLKNKPIIGDENEENLISDPVIINSLTYLSKTMHDSVDLLTLKDDKRQISNLIIDYISFVSFKRDFQSHLNFLVEARSNFSNLEMVVAYLVSCVNRIAMETRAIAKGHYSKKRYNFIRAGLAFSYITIPSIDDIFIRLQLYLNSAQVALINCCLPQADSFIYAAIDLLSTIPSSIDLKDGRTKSSDTFLHSYIANLLSFLLIVPDHPEKEPLKLFHDLFQVVLKLETNPNSDEKINIYLDFLKILTIAFQEIYPYHIEKVDSNDTLYGNDSNFCQEICNLCTLVNEELLSYLKILGERKLFKRQSKAALQCFICVVSLGDSQKMNKLAFNLWRLALREADDVKPFKKCLDFVKHEASLYQDKNLEELANKMANLLN